MVLLAAAVSNGQFVHPGISRPPQLDRVPQYEPPYLQSRIGYAHQLRHRKPAFHAVLNVLLGQLAAGVDGG